MIPIILESPYSPRNGKTTAENVEYAQWAMKQCLLRGEAPFASHLLYTQCLDDTVAVERGLGMGAGFAWHHYAERMVVAVDNGMSTGMFKGILRFCYVHKNPLSRIVFRRSGGHRLDASVRDHFGHLKLVFGRCPSVECW